MFLKHIALALAGLLLLALTWRLAQSDWARALTRPAGKPAAAPIQFDNGSVRQYDNPASVAARHSGQPLPLGTLRKCQRGAEVSYTNSFCPPGMREHKLDKGTVNVLPSGPAAPPRATGPAAAPQPTLREQAVQRAIDQATQR